MGWTKRQFVTQAFEEIGLAAYVFDLTPEQLQSALNRLDSMVASWNAKVIRLGYPISSSPQSSNLDEETNVAEGATTPIKSLFSVYRFWAEDRGEKPMSQTAFQKKMLERSVDLVGHGSKAVVHGRSLKPRPVMSNEVDWGAINRFAR